jgi:hypothetical protein
MSIPVGEGLDSDPNTLHALSERMREFADQTEAYRLGVIPAVKTRFGWVTREGASVKLKIVAEHNDDALDEDSNSVVTGDVETFRISVRVEEVLYEKMPAEAVMAAVKVGFEPKMTPEDELRVDYRLGVTFTEDDIMWSESRTYYVRNEKTEESRAMNVELYSFDSLAEPVVHEEAFELIMASLAKDIKADLHTHQIQEKIGLANVIMDSVTGRQMLPNLDFSKPRDYAEQQ